MAADDSEALRTLAERWPDAVCSFEYGRSAEGRPLRALAASRCGALSAETLRALLESESPSSLLHHVALLFVPAFNTDGHERVGRWNRPNQAGPDSRASCYRYTTAQSAKRRGLRLSRARGGPAIPYLGNFGDGPGSASSRRTGPAIRRSRTPIETGKTVIRRKKRPMGMDCVSPTARPAM